jgi:uncharacterized membrane protein YbhN (UPF0104 family)
MIVGGPPVVEEPDGDSSGGQATRRRLRATQDIAKRLLAGRVVRWGFAAVAAGLGAFAVAEQWAGIRKALAAIGMPTATGAMIAVLAGLFATMRVWQILLAGLGSLVPARVAARILFLGQLGKYLPGSLWPILAQMELGRAYQVPRNRSASASVLTMLVSLLTGLLTALVTLPFIAGATPYLWTFLAAPPLIACLHPRVLNPLMRRLLRLARQPAPPQPLTGRTLAHALAWSFAAWVCNGVQLWLIAIRLGAPAGTGMLLAVGGYAFAWCAGFLVVFAPAGVGVREVFLVATLSPTLGVGGATAAALVSRALTTVGDLLSAAVAWLTARSAARR